MPAGCTLLILAGGGSRRMGRDKAFLPVGDVPLIEHLVRRLAPVVDETMVAGGTDPLLNGVTFVPDRFHGMGPLAGMQAGFLEARHNLVWVVACDLPDIEPALGPCMLGFAQDFDAVVPHPGREPQGLCAIYRRELAARIETSLLAREQSVKHLLGISNVRYLSAAELRIVDPELRSFRNLNTPADYEAWIRSR